jgi:hypothetical protein
MSHSSNFLTEQMWSTVSLSSRSYPKFEVVLVLHSPPMAASLPSTASLHSVTTPAAQLTHTTIRPSDHSLTTSVSALTGQARLSTSTAEHQITLTTVILILLLFTLLFVSALVFKLLRTRSSSQSRDRFDQAQINHLINKIAAVARASTSRDVTSRSGKL